MAAAEVVIRVAAQGAGEAESRLSRLGQSLQRLGALAESLPQLGVAAGVFGVALARVLRLDFASEVEAIRNQLAALTGDTESAERALGGLLDLALTTRFETSDVARFGALLMGVGVSAEQAQQELSALLDLMAGLGARRSDFERIAFNLLQLRGGAFTAADIRQMVMALPGIGVALGRAVGAERPLTPDQIAALARTLGGEQFFQLLMDAAQQFRGAARMLTIADMAANLFESIAIAMLPSAEAFAFVLRGIVGVATRLVSLFGTLNRALFGLPGLFVALGASAMAAVASLRLLARVGVTAAFAELMGGLRWLAGLFRTLRGLGAAGALAAAWRWLAGIVGTLGRVLGGLVGLFGRLASALGRLGGLAAIAGVVVSLLGWLVGRRHARLGQQLGILGESMGIGTTIGAILGSIIPGIGTAIGSLIGLVVGAIVGLIRILLGGREEQRATRNAAQQTARNTQQMASALQDIKIHLVGGGERARFAATRYEVEAYLRRLAFAGI